jgi:FAD/FMN-containing dehydrogenase
MPSRYFDLSLSGWGNFRPETCRVYRPEKLGDEREIVRLPNGDSSLIARGLGRSYGDSATNAGGAVALQERMDSLIDFDAAAGEVEAEAGVSLATLIELLVPRGFFLPVVPGTKFVTLGGAVAADIHGKNHHIDGTFGKYVLNLRLLLAGGDVVTCSPSKNAELFWATIGGMGLTGVILSVRLKLLPISSAYMKVDYRRVPNLDAALDRFESAEGQAAKYSVAWIDCLAGGASLGRAVIMEGDHVPAAELSGRRARSPLAMKARRRRAVRFFYPRLAMTKFNVRMFNRLYYRRHSDRTRVVDLDTFFFPLDRIHNWNRIYGRRGFVQYQALVPPAAARQGLRELLEKISLAGQASFLAVLKRTGEQGNGLLSFPMPGYTLALDFPNRGQATQMLAGELDEILLRHGGRLYLAKDSLMSAETFAKMYPRLEEFRRIKTQVDPQSHFSSTQARRLKITS